MLYCYVNLIWSTLRLQGHSVKSAKLTSGQVATAAAEPAAGEPVPASVQYQLVVDTAINSSPQQTVTWITNSAKPQVSGCANYTMMVQKLTELMNLKSGPIQALVLLRQGGAAVTQLCQSGCSDLHRLSCSLLSNYWVAPGRQCMLPASTRAIP